jgi:hypothetical protein
MFAPRAGADQVDPQSIRPEDLQEWKRALEEQAQAATRALNELRMYESIGCGAGPQELANALSQVNERMFMQHARIAAKRTTAPG